MKRVKRRFHIGAFCMHAYEIIQADNLFYKRKNIITKFKAIIAGDKSS